MYDFPPQILEALMIDIKLVREACKIDNNLDALIYYIFNLLKNPKGVKLLHKRLESSKIDKKIINSFIYTMLKFKYKLDSGTWSWFEIDEYDIPLEDIKKTTTTYTME